MEEAVVVTKVTNTENCQDAFFRLKQIKMSEYDAELYERFSKGVRRQVKSFKVILDSLQVSCIHSDCSPCRINLLCENETCTRTLPLNLQAKGKERQWLKHQSHGDLDDAKLIEGLTGERTIYKRRGEKEPEVCRSVSDSCHVGRGECLTRTFTAHVKETFLIFCSWEVHSKNQST